MRLGFPPKNPAPPTPWNRPFQLFKGRAMKILTLSPAGGWVSVALTRQTPESMAAESMVVFWNWMSARLSQDRTGSCAWRVRAASRKMDFMILIDVEKLSHRYRE